jgi:hypothetical protein
MMARFTFLSHRTPIFKNHKFSPYYLDNLSSSHCVNVAKLVHIIVHNKLELAFEILSDAAASFKCTISFQITRGRKRQFLSTKLYRVLNDQENDL